MLFIENLQGETQLIYNGFVYNRKAIFPNGLTTWKCSSLNSMKCRAVIITKNNVMMAAKGHHNHKKHWNQESNKIKYNRRFKEWNDKLLLME